MLLQITTAAGREGPFETVEATPNGFIVTANGGREALPKSVIGSGKIEPWVGPLPPPAQPDLAERARQLQADIVEATQRRLDEFAKLRNYDGILSACTYAGSAVPRFAAEAAVAMAARDATWATLYSLLGEINAGTRPVPSGYAEIEPLLPTIEWPAI